MGTNVIPKKEYTIRDIQESIFSVIKDIDTFCRENDIQYYLMGGSALGAMRHKGFIPWDDDLDIFMTYDNYEKFIRLFEQQGEQKLSTDGKVFSLSKDKYFIQRENTNEWPMFLSRVCLKGTTMVSDEFKFNMKQYHTIFVDIMCLYSAPKNNAARWIQYMAAQLLRVNALARCNFPNKSTMKRLALGISKIVVNPVTRSFIIRYVHLYEGKNTEYMGHYFGRARFKNTSFPRKYLGNPRYVPFEDAELPVFENVEDYLKIRFGPKWMEKPSKETREQYPVHGNFVDLERDYTEYMSEDMKSWLY